MLSNHTICGRRAFPRPGRLCGLFCAFGLVVASLAGCSSGPATSVDPFEVADDGDILDDPAEADHSARQRRAEAQRADAGSMYVIPEASADPARPIDANPDSVDPASMRTFDEERFVFEETRHWDGPDDLSFRAAVEADDSHIYFLIDVVDDQVVDSDPSSPVDAVIIRLRDPQLDELLASIPETTRSRLAVDMDVAIAITPDGRAGIYDSNHRVPASAVHTAGRRTDNGYTVEAAFALEAMPAVANLPLPQVAFRIEVFDHDDSSASAPRTRMTATPTAAGETPRFAVLRTPGLLPAAAPDRAPPRYDALGIWRQKEQQWTFEPIEYVSPRWIVMETTDVLREPIDESTGLPDECLDSGADRQIVEAYQEASGSYRVALVLCGPTAGDRQCPAESRTQLVWTALEYDEPRGWTLTRSFQVFEQPLEQCTDKVATDQVLTSNFSMLPFDVVGSWVFGVGWHQSMDQHRQKYREATVTLVDPRSSSFVLGETRLRRVTASPRARTLYESRAYLTDLDDDGRMDLCQVEEIEEQHCRSYLTDCQTHDRGFQRLTHIFLWDRSEHRFQTYPMDRHGDCRASVEFDDIDGYKILLIGDRLGLISAGPND